MIPAFFYKNKYNLKLKPIKHRHNPLHFHHIHIQTLLLHFRLKNRLEKNLITPSFAVKNRNIYESTPSAYQKTPDKKHPPPESFLFYYK